MAKPSPLTTAPPFELPNQKGEVRSLSEFLARCRHHRRNRLTEGLDPVGAGSRTLEHEGDPAQGVDGFDDRFGHTARLRGDGRRYRHLRESRAVRRTAGRVVGLDAVGPGADAAPCPVVPGRARRGEFIARSCPAMYFEPKKPTPLSRITLYGTFASASP